MGWLQSFAATGYGSMGWNIQNEWTKHSHDLGLCIFFWCLFSSWNPKKWRPPYAKEQRVRPQSQPEPNGTLAAWHIAAEPCSNKLQPWDRGTKSFCSRKCWVLTGVEWCWCVLITFSNFNHRLPLSDIQISSNLRLLAQIRTFARSLCFFGKNDPSFQQTPTKSWKGSWRKFLVLPDLRFSRKKRPFCTTCMLDKIEYNIIINITNITIVLFEVVVLFTWTLKGLISFLELHTPWHPEGLPKMSSPVWRESSRSWSARGKRRSGWLEPGAPKATQGRCEHGDFTVKNGGIMGIYWVYLGWFLVSNELMIERSRNERIVWIVWIPDFWGRDQVVWPICPGVASRAVFATALGSLAAAKPHFSRQLEVSIGFLSHGGTPSSHIFYWGASIEISLPHHPSKP